MATTGKYLKGRLQGKRDIGIEEIGMVKEDLDPGLNQLDSTNSASIELQQELQSEEKLTEDVRAQIDHLQGVIAQIGEDKKALDAEVGQKQDAIDTLQQRINQFSLEIKDKEISIDNLNLSLAGMESEGIYLTSVHNQTKHLAQANSSVESFEEEARKMREELELKKSLEKDLNTRLKLLVSERDEINKKVHVLHEEYNDLKSASAKRAASDAKLLSNKDHELNQLKHHRFLFASLLLLLSLFISVVFLHEPGKSNTTKVEQERQLQAPANPFVGFLNGVGMIGLCVLGALYALAQKEMRSLNSIIDSMKNKLSEKEATMAERIEEIRKVKKDLAFTSNQLAFANSELTKLQELQAEKKLAEDLNYQIDHPQSVVVQAGKDEKILEAELRQKQVAADILQERINLLCLEIKDKEDGIKNLNLLLAGNESDSKEVQKSLNHNLDEVKLSLKQRSDELVSVKEALRKTKQELLVMNDELKDVIKAREDLKKELLEVNKKAETTATDLKEEKRLVALLNNELEELRKHISKDKDARGELERELQEATNSLEEMNKKALMLSRELDKAISKSASLETEKDMLAKSLAEEKNAAKELQVKLEELSQHTLKDKDARGKLERDLQGATKSLEEMNKKALMLSKELDIAISKSASLETEKDILARSLAEEKNAAKEVQVSLADAHKILAGLHDEMESLEKKSEMLQEQLASAKRETEEWRRAAQLGTRAAGTRGRVGWRRAPTS